VRTYAGTRVRVTLASIPLVLGVALSGCGGDDATDDPEASGDAGSATTSAGPSEPTTEATTDPATTAPATGATDSSGTPEAAAGQPITMKTFTATLPEPWELRKGNDTESDEAFVRSELVGTMFFRTFDASGLDFAFFKDMEKDDAKNKFDFTEEPDRVVDGQSGMVLRGSSDGTKVWYEWMTLKDGWITRIEFQLVQPQGDPDQLIDSVLDSVHFVPPPAS
jgi:hypothetical protein